MIWIKCTICVPTMPISNNSRSQCQRTSGWCKPQTRSCVCSCFTRRCYSTGEGFGICSGCTSTPTMNRRTTGWPPGLVPAPSLDTSCIHYWIGYSPSRSGFVYILVSRVVLYVYGILAMAYWRGVWGVADYYLLQYGWKAGTIGLLVSYTTLLLLRCSRTLIFPPFVVTLDTRKDVLQPSTLFQTEVHGNIKSFNSMVKSPELNNNIWFLLKCFEKIFWTDFMFIYINI